MAGQPGAGAPTPVCQALAGRALGDFFPMCVLEQMGHRENNKSQNGVMLATCA